MSKDQIEAKADYLNHDGHVRTRTYLGPTLHFTNGDGSRLLNSLAVNHLAPGGVEHGIFNQHTGVERAPEPYMMDKSDKKLYWLTKLSMSGHSSQLSKIKDDMRENPVHGFYSISNGDDMWEKAKQAAIGHTEGRLMPIWMKNTDTKMPNSEYNDLNAVMTASSTNQNKAVPVKSTHSAGKLKDNRKSILKKLGKR